MEPFTKIIMKNLWWFTCYIPRLHRMYKHPERYTDEQFYNVGMKCVKWIMRAGHVQLETYGLENIPEGGCLVCPNHQDKLDPLAVWMTYPRSINVVLADKVMKYPVVGNIIRSLGAIVLQKDSLKAMYHMSQEIQGQLAKDQSIMLFPEGDYTDDVHHLLPFMTGCFRAPQRAERPIVPVAIIDSFRAVRKGEKPPFIIQVHYLQPVMPEEMQGLKTAEISAIVSGRIQAVLDERQK